MKKVYYGGFGAFFFICIFAVSVFAASPTLILPNGGESINAGDAYTIQWSASVDSVTYNLYLSCDNGTSWSRINPVVLTSVTSFNWQVITPVSNKTKCLIKVIGYNGSGVKVGADVSDTVFTVSVLNVTSPNGGEKIEAGSIVDVTWSTDTLVPVSSAKLVYSVDDGITWLPIKGPAITGNPGTYRWTVPQLTSGLCRVKVTLLKADDAVAATDKSNAIFTIKAAPKSNASFNGEYFRSGASATSDADTQLHDFTANGNGTVNFSTIVSSSGAPSGTITYSMYPNGRFDARNNIDGDSRHGILSPDNGLFLISNTTPANGIGFGFGIKASAGLDNNALNGTYAMGSISKIAGGGGWTDLSEVTFDGAGNGTVHCVYISNGSCFADFGFTYAVSSNGRVTTSMPGWAENGVVSSDGRIFTVVATSTPDSMRSFRAGMRKAAGGLSDATFAGKFIGLSFGATKSGMYVNVMSLKANGAGVLTLADLYNSFGGLTQGTATYSVGADGMLNVPDGSPTGFNGVILDNGQAWLTVDTDTSDGQNEMSVTIGLKTSK